MSSSHHSVNKSNVSRCFHIKHTAKILMGIKRLLLLWWLPAASTAVYVLEDASFNTSPSSGWLMTAFVCDIIESHNSFQGSYMCWVHLRTWGWRLTFPLMSPDSHKQPQLMSLQYSYLMMCHLCPTKGPLIKSGQIKTASSIHVTLMMKPWPKRK